MPLVCRCRTLIKMKQYIDNIVEDSGGNREEGFLIEVSTGLCIPKVEGNRHYNEYLELQYESDLEEVNGRPATVELLPPNIFPNDHPSAYEISEALVKADAHGGKIAALDAIKTRLGL